MRVKEFALAQLHTVIRNDPWVQEIMIAAGTPLDEIAEKLIEVWNADDFDNLSLEQCQRYERMLRLSVTFEDLDNRRSAIKAAWRTNEKPSAEMLRQICESWRGGEVTVAYDHATYTATLTFSGQIGIPDDINALKSAVDRAVPAHITVVYAYRFYRISEVNSLKISEISAIKLSNFAGGS